MIPKSLLTTKDQAFIFFRVFSVFRGLNWWLKND